MAGTSPEQGKNQWWHRAYDFDVWLSVISPAGMSYERMLVTNKLSHPVTFARRLDFRMHAPRENVWDQDPVVVGSSLAAVPGTGA